MKIWLKPNWNQQQNKKKISIYAILMEFFPNCFMFILTHRISLVSIAFSCETVRFIRLWRSGCDNLYQTEKSIFPSIFPPILRHSLLAHHKHSHSFPIIFRIVVKMPKTLWSFTARCSLSFKGVACSSAELSYVSLHNRWAGFTARNKT